MVVAAVLGRVEKSADFTTVSTATAKGIAVCVTNASERAMVFATSSNEAVNWSAVVFGGECWWLLSALR